MKKIPLTKGYFALVDDKDFGWLNKWKWHVSVRPHTRYAVRRTKGQERLTDGTAIKMHQQILGIGKSEKTDHINGNGLDNRRSNLRICSSKQNAMNRDALKTGTSEFKGVHWHKRDKKWYTRIGIDGRRISLGYHDSAIAAAKAYDEKARELFGKYARLNFPEEGEQGCLK
jgi:hypothetical protein